MLSQTCEYALRATTYIARNADKKPVLAKDIASQMHVPLRYLQKVLRSLVHSGILVSARGIGGGFRLGRPPEEVRVADVLAPFDSGADRTRCPFGHPICDDTQRCPVHTRWEHVVAAYASFVETTTLADLMRTM